MGLLFVLLGLAIAVALLAVQTGLRAEDRADAARPASWRSEPGTASTTNVVVIFGPVTSSTAGRRP